MDTSAPNFLRGGGEMAARVRTYDWSTTPLGPIDGWPRSLRSAVGLVLENGFPTVLCWGRALTAIYNDAYRPLLGSKPEALGRPFLEVWPEALDVIGPIAEKALAGEASYFESAPFTLMRHGYPEQTYFDFSVSPLRDETGAVAGILNTTVEVTGKILAERRLEFLLDLAERLRGLVDPIEVMTVAAEALGRRVGVARAGYGEVDPTQEIVSVERDWTNGTVASLAGQARILDAFGPAAVAELKAGRTLAVEDGLVDLRAGPAFAATWDSIGCRALIVVPLIRDGRLKAVLYLHEPEPRRWTDAETALAKDVAERTWAAVERARAEEAHHAERDRSVEILESISDAFYAVDRDWRFAYVNRKAQELWGRSSGELIGKIYWEEFPQAVGSESYHAHLRAMREGAPVRCETVSPILGQWIGIDIHPTSTGGLSVYFRNIDDRKQAEAALRASEQRFRALVSASSDVVYRMSPDWSEMRHLVGRDFIADTTDPSRAWLEKYIHPDDRQRVTEAIDEAVRTKSIFELEHQVLRVDGTLGWTFSRAVPLLDANGAITEWFGAASDVTVRKRAEERLRDSEARLRSAFSISTVGVMFWGGGFGLTDMNDAFLRMTGFSRDEALGLTWRDLTPEEFHPESERAVHEVTTVGETTPYEKQYFRKDGSRWWGLFAARRIGDEVVEFVLDVTDRKRAEEHRDLLLAELNHRVKNTLSAVQSIATQTLRSTASPEAFRDAFTERLMALAQAHNLLSRTNWEGAQLREVVRTAFAPHLGAGRSRISAEGRDVALEPRSALALAMAFHELATNAAKYGALSVPGGRVDVTWEVRRSDAGRTLRIRWTEAGGPPVAVPRHRGFGSAMIERGLAHELDGEVELTFEPAGLRCTMTIPLAAG